jgi:hypothetical protein
MLITTSEYFSNPLKQLTMNVFAAFAALGGGDQKGAVLFNALR